MQIWDQQHRHIGVNTTQDQRVCDHCQHRFMSGFIYFSRSYSVEAICDQCVVKDHGKRVLPPAL